MKPYTDSADLGHGLFDSFAIGSAVDPDRCAGENATRRGNQNSAIKTST
jgi:hypothetical protein